MRENMGQFVPLRDGDNHRGLQRLQFSQLELFRSLARNPAGRVDQDHVGLLCFRVLHRGSDALDALPGDTLWRGVAGEIKALQRHIGELLDRPLQYPQADAARRADRALTHVSIHNRNLEPSLIREIRKGGERVRLAHVHPAEHEEDRGALPVR